MQTWAHSFQRDALSSAKHSAETGHTEAERAARTVPGRTGAAPAAGQEPAGTGDYTEAEHTDPVRAEHTAAANTGAEQSGRTEAERAAGTEED